MKKLIPYIIKLLGRLPLCWGRALGSAIGRVMWLLRGRAAKVTLKNLQVCYPELNDPERQQLAKNSLRQTAKTLLEAAQVWVKPHTWLEQQVAVVNNAELIEAAVKAKRGLIVLAPHLGNWEVVGPWICQRWGITTMYAPGKNPQLDQLILQSRQKTGSKLAPANMKGVMALVKALKNGEVIGILPDQVPDEKGGDFAPFFGQPALTMTLVHSLIKRTGCSVVMAQAKRVNKGFELIFEEPDAEIFSEDVAVSLAALNRSIEQCIGHCPEQYQWEYKRFRKQPEGVEKVY